jgi:hypothetical protein
MLAIFLLMVGLGACRYLPSTINSGIWFTPAAIVLPVAYSTYFIWSQVSARRLRSKLMANDWRNCLYCFFDLSGLEKAGTCPECGERFEICKVQNEWRKGIAEEMKVG